MPVLVVASAIAILGCGGDADGAGRRSATPQADTVTTNQRGIGGLFPPVPAPYSYNPQDEATAKQFQDLLASEDGQALRAGEGRTVSHDGQTVGIQISYLVNDSLDLPTFVDGYLDSTGGGKVTKTTVDGRQVHLIERPNGHPHPFAYVYFSKDAAVVVSATTRGHADAIIGAVVAGV